MTTKVTVDAHAGWPVLVVTEVGEPGNDKTIDVVRVEPNTVQDFCIHSGMRILSVQECKRTD